MKSLVGWVIESDMWSVGKSGTGLKFTITVLKHSQLITSSTDYEPSALNNYIPPDYFSYDPV